MNPIAFRLPPCCALARASCFDLAGPSSSRLPTVAVLITPYHAPFSSMPCSCSGERHRGQGRGGFVAGTAAFTGVKEGWESCQPADVRPSFIVPRGRLTEDASSPGFPDRQLHILGQR